MSPDLVNGLFEFSGSIMLWQNVLRLHRDRQIKGVSIGPTAFFTAWGLWNLVYYPSLHQTFSFLGGVCLVVANIVWLGQMFIYRPRSSK